jgi:hypothetical protein
MSLTIDLVTGDPFIKTINLQKVSLTGAAAFTIPPGTEVKAAIITADHTVLLTTPVNVLESETGSDWANSKVVVNIPKTETDTIDVSIIENGLALLAIQVNDGGELTFFTGVKLIKGLID